MSAVDAVRIIGLSHLLQPPLTLFMASERGLGVRSAVVATSPLGAAVMHNMAFASVALPTALGLVLALHAREALELGAAHTLGSLLAAFWTWRLVRQVTALRAAWPGRPLQAVLLHPALVAIFVVQGPILGWLMLGI